MEFSLFFFSDNGATSSRQKYELLLEASRFGDQHGFAAVWTPERHFAPFGGLYPNPSVTAAAIAAITTNIGIRAGSVILPLQNPIRVAEEWSVVDNLSHGRVAISAGRGWNVNDFALAPSNYKDSRSVMYEHLDVIKRLWRGDAIRVKNGSGEEVEISIYPRPIQKQLPVWISVESEESFIKAGSLGANVLTHLVLKSIEDLEKGIRLYRDSLSSHGYDPSRGRVTLMMHTFLARDYDRAYMLVDDAYSQYIGNYLEFRGSAHFQKVTPEDGEYLRKRAVERLVTTNGLVGTPQQCADRVVALQSAGVSEIACLIDFGIPANEVLNGLVYLNELQALTS